MQTHQIQSKRQLQKDATRENILRTAMRVYATRGFSASTQVIAQEAGVAHGSIFVHFPTREALQLRILERFAEEIGEKLHGLVEAEGDIATLLRAHIGVLEAYEPFYKGLVSELSALPDEARNTLIALQSVMSHHFGAAIEAGVRRGEIKAIPLPVLLNTWLGLLHYYLQNSELFAPGESVLKRCGEDLVNGFVALIAK